MHTAMNMRRYGIGKGRDSEAMIEVILALELKKGWAGCGCIRLCMMGL